MSWPAVTGGKLTAGHRPWVLLSLLFAAHVAANVIWVSQDQTMRGVDTGPHIEAQVYATQLLRGEGLRGVWMVARGGGAGIWPSFSYLPWAVTGLLFGHSLAAVKLFNLLSLALLLTSVFLIGRRLRSAGAGLLAAALVSLYPAVYGEGRQFGADFPGMAMTALGILMLLRTERYSRARATLAFGLVAGLGLLIRPQVLFFLGPPALGLVLLCLWLPAVGGRGRALLHAALGAAVAAAVSAVWWLGRSAEIIQSFANWQKPAAVPRISDVGGPSSLVFYLGAAPWIFSSLLLLAGAVALVGLWRRGRGQPGGADASSRIGIILCAIWLLGGLAVMSTMTFRFVRFLLPLVPALAVLTGVGLASLPHRPGRRVTIALFLVGASSSWLFDSFAADGPVHFGWGANPFVHRELFVTSGPPAQNPIIGVAGQAARLLGAEHGSGRGVSLRMELHPAVPAFRLLWFASPMLRLGLPEIHLQGVPHSEFRWDHVSGRYQRIAGAFFPEVRAPARHCYLLGFAGRRVSPEDPRPEGPATRLRQWVIPGRARDRDQLRKQTWWLFGHGGPLRITLWRLARCPASAQAGEAE